MPKRVIYYIIKHMENKKNEILKTFYPNKFLIFVYFLLCGGLSIIFFDIMKNPPLEMGLLARILHNLPFIKELLVFIVSISAILLLLIYVSIESGHYYVKVTYDGIAYSNFQTLFEEKKILWKDIEDFYIESIPNVGKYVKIKFKNYFMPSNIEKNLSIHGNSRKVIKILKDYLSKYGHK